MYLLLHADSPGNDYAGHLLSQGINLITWQASGNKEHTHASILINPAKKEIIEAYYPKIHHKILEDKELPFIDCLEVPGVDEAKALEFLEAQVDKPYSVVGLLQFALEIPPEETGRSYFCSELAFSAFLAGGVSLFKNCPAYKVSPGLLWISPEANYLGKLSDVIHTLK